MARPELNKRSFFRPVQQGVTLFAITLSILALGLALYSARWILFLLLMGLGFGTLLIPLIDFQVNRFRLPRALALGLTLVALLSSLGVATYYGLLLLSRQWALFSARAPGILESAWLRFQEWLLRFSWVKMPVAGFPKLGPTLPDLISTAMNAMASSISGIGGLSFVIAVAFYFAADPDQYRRGFLSAFPAHARGRVDLILTRVGQAVRAWFVSQGIAMAIVGVAVGLFLWLIGSSYWFLLAVLTAALELVAFVGPAIALVLAGVLTLASQPDRFLWVLIVYFAVLRLEGDLVIPWVMKERIRVPPIPLLTVMLLLGAWFGVLGLLIATPLMAVLRTIYLLTYVPAMDHRVRPESAEPPAA